MASCEISIQVIQKMAKGFFTIAVLQFSLTLDEDDTSLARHLFLNVRHEYSSERQSELVTYFTTSRSRTKSPLSARQEGNANTTFETQTLHVRLTLTLTLTLTRTPISYPPNQPTHNHHSLPQQQKCLPTTTPYKPSPPSSSSKSTTPPPPSISHSKPSQSSAANSSTLTKPASTPASCPSNSPPPPPQLCTPSASHAASYTRTSRP